MIPVLSRVGRREGTEVYDGAVVREGERSSSVVSDRLSKSDMDLDEMSAIDSPSVAILEVSPIVTIGVNSCGATIRQCRQNSPTDARGPGA